MFNEIIPLINIAIFGRNLAKQCHPKIYVTNVELHKYIITYRHTEEILERLENSKAYSSLFIKKDISEKYSF